MEIGDFKEAAIESGILCRCCQNDSSTCGATHNEIEITEHTAECKYFVDENDCEGIDIIRGKRWSLI